MGWSIDILMWFEVRDKILKDRYAGCCYSVDCSDSPVIIAHRGITRNEMRKITKLFPKNIRVEFQEVEYEGERTSIYGFGSTRPIKVDICSMPGSAFKG